MQTKLDLDVTAVISDLYHGQHVYVDDQALLVDRHLADDLAESSLEFVLDTALSEYLEFKHGVDLDLDLLRQLVEASITLGDIVDTEKQLNRLADSLRKRGLGLVTTREKK